MMGHGPKRLCRVHAELADKEPKVKSKLKDIAARIAAHLRRFEMDPKINKALDATHLRPFYNANAYLAGSRVAIVYVSFQIRSTLTMAEALHFLAWLDAGNVGRHWEADKERRK